MLSTKGSLTQTIALDAPTLTLTGESSVRTVTYLKPNGSPTSGPPRDLLAKLWLSGSLPPSSPRAEVCSSWDPSLPPHSVCKRLPGGLTFFFYCCVTSYHTLSQHSYHKTPRLLAHSSVGQKSDHCYWVLCSGSHEAGCRCVGALDPTVIIIRTNKLTYSNY